MALHVYVQTAETPLNNYSRKCLGGAVGHDPAFGSVLITPVNVSLFCIAVETENELRAAFITGYCAFISAPLWGRGRSGNCYLRFEK